MKQHRNLRQILLVACCCLIGIQLGSASPGKLSDQHHIEKSACCCLQQVGSVILSPMTDVQNLSQQDDIQLVEAIQNRSESAAHEHAGTEAFSILYKRYAGQLIAFLKTRLGDMATTQEVAQETWLRIWEKCETHFDGGHFRGWMYQIARNLMHDRIRKKTPGELSEFSIPTTNDDSNYWEDVTEKVGTLKTCVRELTEDQQAVVQGRLLGQSYAEISEHQNIAFNTAQTRFHRAKQLLKDCIEREDA